MTLPDELISRCDVLIVNQSELEALASQPAASADLKAVVRAQRTLLDRGARAVLATLGPAGAILATSTQALYQAAPRSRVVDTIGAGDAVCGAFAASLANGESLPTATRHGVAAGTLAVQSAAAQSRLDLARLRAATADLPPSVIL
jgi:ribokinase